VTLSAVATTLFLGGWRAPWPLSWIPGVNEGWLPVVWFLGKMTVFLFVYVWLRGTLPRQRYDQFMRLGWKVLIPLSLVWVIAVCAMRVLRAELSTVSYLVIGAIALVLLVGAALLIPDRAPEGQDDEDAEPRTVSDYPVPPLDLAVPASPPRRRRAVTSGSDGAGAKSTDGDGERTEVAAGTSGEGER